MSSAVRHYSALVDYVAQHRDSVSQELVLGLLEMGSSRRDDMARLPFHRQTISDDRLDAAFDQLGRKTGQVRGWLASQLSMETSLDDAALVHVLAAISWLGRDSAYAAGDLELASMLLAPRWTASRSWDQTCGE